MNKKMIGIIVYILLIVAAILPAAGTIDENKISRQESFNFDNLIHPFLDVGSCRSDWSEEAKLFASDGETYDMFGRSISISGDYAIIGAPWANTFTGSAYVFKRTGRGWIEEQKLTASDGEPGDYFGWAVFISGDFIIIGASTDDTTGSAYIFKRTNRGWTEEAKLTASDGEPEDFFGSSVSISGDYTIIGALWADSYTGSAYVFKRTDRGWIEEQKLTASDGEPEDFFGSSVSISGNYIIIGANPEYKTGSAYVFKRTGRGWIEEQKLTASDGEPSDYFGSSVSIGEDYAIIGAYGDDSFTGSVYVFKRIDRGWIEEQKLTASDGEPNDFFGFSVSISGDYIIIGTPGDYSTGSAYVFKRTDRGWTEEAKLIASDGEPDDYFSFSVSISGDYVIIGAYGDDSFTGSAYVFKAPNLPPEKPTVTGPTIGEPGIEYEYTFVTIDPNGDEVSYFIDWDDGNVQGWLGPYSSGQELKVNHIFDKDGIYKIKAKARDIYKVESEWSDPFSVRIGNRAPEKPEITGKRNGKFGTEYKYTFITTDPDEDDVSYYIKWGDGDVTDWTAFQASDTPYSENHSWSNRGKYKIETKAKDPYGAESDWATYTVNMPRNRATYNSLLVSLLEQFPLLQKMFSFIF